MDVNKIERLISQKRDMNAEDCKTIDAHILYLTQATLPRGDFKAHSETDTQQRIRVKAVELGCVLWRNNSGVLTDKNGRPVRYGLGNDSGKINKVFKSADLIGIMRGGTFIAVECKRPGWTAPENDREKAQWAFLIDVVAKGGMGFFATNVEDFTRRITNGRPSTD